MNFKHHQNAASAPVQFPGSTLPNMFTVSGIIGLRQCAPHLE